MYTAKLGAYQTMNNMLIIILLLPWRKSGRVVASGTM